MVMSTVILGTSLPSGIAPVNLRSDLGCYTCICSRKEALVLLNI